MLGYQGERLFQGGDGFAYMHQASTSRGLDQHVLWPAESIAVFCIKTDTCTPLQVTGPGLCLLNYTREPCALLWHMCYTCSHL